MNLRMLPLLTGLLPVFAIHASYLIAIQAERVPACLPYLEGCTSISATGRYPPASFLFKPAMTAAAVLLALFWLYTSAWLRQLELQANRVHPGPVPRIAWLGGCGAVAMIIYLAFLGTQEPFYEFMRRFGIYLFFLLTILAQLDMSWRLHTLSKTYADSRLPKLARLLLTLAILPFVLGVLNLVLKNALADADQAENVIEWIVVLMIQAHIALTYFAWRETGFTVTLAVAPRGR